MTPGRRPTGRPSGRDRSGRRRRRRAVGLLGVLLVGRASIVVYLRQPFRGIGLAQRRAGPVAGLVRRAPGLQRCATEGRDCRYALSGTARQRFMGRWSDGRPVPLLEVG